MKRIFSAILAIVTITAFTTACSESTPSGGTAAPASSAAAPSEKGGDAATDEKEFSLKVGDNWGVTHPMAAALDNVFKTQIEEKSGGKIKVEVYHDGLLGDEAALWQGVRDGSIDFAVVGTPMNQEFTMMLISDWRMGLVTLAGLLVFFLVNTLMQRNEQAVSQRKFNADERLVAKVLEYVQGIAEVKNFDLTKDSTTQVGDAVDECRKAAFGMEVPSVIFTFLQFLANKFTGVAVCASALVFYFNGTMPLAMCLMMLICSFILFEQLDSAGSYSTLFRSIDIGVEKANAILHVPPMDIDGQDILPERCDIALEHVDFSYDQKKILDDVSLTIPEKTTVAIVGPSGSGKTTLCHLMARFWDVQGGRVTLGGRDVRAYSYDSLMRNFSFVFQRTYLFSDTIANNIRFGKPDASMEEVIAAAKKARCHDFIKALPKGYDTVIGEGGASISGGERQRITIARAIMKDAPIIILDEATANVDPENEKDLVEAIQELTHDKTVIMIAHRLKTVRNADCIFVVDGGKIVQRGTHEELVGQDGIYRRFVVERRQASGWKV